MNEQIRLLLVEDNPADAALLEDVVRGSREARLEISRAGTLGEALQVATTVALDLCLLDLSLPDAQNLEGLSTLLRAVPHLPIIVFTGRDDEAMGLRAVQEGAQDYLIKGQLDAHLLIRSFRYAIERTRTQEMARNLATAQAARSEAERQIERYRRELTSLRNAADQRPAAHPEIPPLKAAPGRETLADLQPLYGQLLDRAFEKQAFKVDYDLFGGVQRLAQKLFEREAGPLDVVEMHGHELDARTDPENWVRSKTYVEVGRLMLIRMLGQLMALYRDAALARRGGSSRD